MVGEWDGQWVDGQWVVGGPSLGAAASPVCLPVCLPSTYMLRCIDRQGRRDGGVRSVAPAATAGGQARVPRCGPSAWAEPRALHVTSSGANNRPQRPSFASFASITSIAFHARESRRAGPRPVVSRPLHRSCPAHVGVPLGPPPLEACCRLLPPAAAVCRSSLAAAPFGVLRSLPRSQPPGLAPIHHLARSSYRCNLCPSPAARLPQHDAQPAWACVACARTLPRTRRRCRCCSRSLWLALFALLALVSSRSAPPISWSWPWPSLPVP
jgi:hypothetical protein